MAIDIIYLSLEIAHSASQKSATGRKLRRARCMINRNYDIIRDNYDYHARRLIHTEKIEFVDVIANQYSLSICPCIH